MDGANRQLDPEQWVEKHGDVLFAHALRRLGSREEAEEVVQETLLAALRGRDNFRHEGSEGAWLMGILKRKVVDALRRKASQAANLEDDGQVVDQLFDERGNWSPAARNMSPLRLDALEREEFLSLFYQCLEDLPGRQAAVFTMREIDERSSEEICKELGISASNLWVLMHRARLRLAECIKARWQVDV